MPLHEPRTWIQLLKRTSASQLCKNFTKSSLYSNYYHLPLLFSLCMLALAPGFSLLAYPAKVSALYLHSLLTLPTPLTSLSLSVCIAHPLAHLCSPSVWLPVPWLSFLISFLAPCPAWLCFLAPVCFLAPSLVEAT